MANRKTIPFNLMTRPPRKARVGPAVLGAKGVQTALQFVHVDSKTHLLFLLHEVLESYL